MAVDITINGTFRTHSVDKIPGFVYAFPMSDFYLGVVAVKASSPENGGNPYKTAAVTAAVGTGANAGTTVYTFSMILPSTTDADVNPVGARWGLYVFDTSNVPRKIEEISDLESFFLLPTPTTVTLLDVRSEQSTSDPWPGSTDVEVDGNLTVAGSITVAGNINGRDPDSFVDGSGTANAYPLWSDANTIGNGYLKQESLALSMDGAGSAPELRMYTNGLAGDTNRTLGVLWADPNVVELTARRNGTFSSQVTSVRLNALGSSGLVQIARDGTVRWAFDGVTLKPNSGGTHTLGNFALPFAALELAFGGTGVTFWNSSAQQVSLQGNIVNTLSMFDSNGQQFGRFNYGDNIFLQANSGTPEGAITANIGSLYSQTDGGVFAKASGTGNTGWVELGYRGIPQNSQSAAYALVLADAGKHIYHPVGDASNRQFTIPANASVAFPLGTAITFVNDSPNDVTVIITTDVLAYADVGAITTLTIPQFNEATILKVLSTRWIASGTAGCTTA